MDIDKLEKVPSGLGNFTSKVDKWDLHKLVPVSVDLGKLSDRVENDIVKKTEYDELVNKLTTLRLKNYDKLW